MNQEPATERGPATPGRYEIRFQGELDERWSVWFDGLTVVADKGTTTVSGDFADQAQIHGVLERIRDLGLGLISVTPIPESTKPSQEENKS